MRKIVRYFRRLILLHDGCLFNDVSLWMMFYPNAILRLMVKNRIELVLWSSRSRPNSAPRQIQTHLNSRLLFGTYSFKKLENHHLRLMDLKLCDISCKKILFVGMGTWKITFFVRRHFWTIWQEFDLKAIYESLKIEIKLTPSFILSRNSQLVP